MTPLESGLIHAFGAPLYWGFSVVGLLGFQLGQSRILISSVLFASCYYFSVNSSALMAWHIGSRELLQIMCLSLPLSLTLAFRVKEARFWNKQSVKRVLFAMSPLLVMGLALILNPKAFHTFVTFQFLPALGATIPQLAILSSIVLAVFTYDSTEKRIRHFRYACLIAIFPFLTAKHITMNMAEQSLQGDLYVVICYTAICAILLHAMVHMYLERIYQDELTSIPNRRALDETLERLDGDYTIAMVDIDHFKGFNDKYGHDEGDNCLRLVASLIAKVAHGKAFRFGGEEFCLLFTRLDKESALKACEEVRVMVEEAGFVVRYGERGEHRLFRKKPKKGEKQPKKIKVTISVGVARKEGAGELVHDVFKKADKALYKAKEKGRNRVVVAQDTTRSSFKTFTEN